MASQRKSLAQLLVTSPISERLTVTALLLLTFATGMVDAISLLILGHLFVANMTGNVIFLGFWFVPRAGVDLTAALVAVGGFLAGTVIGGRLARHLEDFRQWITAALGMEVALLATLALLSGAGLLHYHDGRKLFLIAGLALTFGVQNASARRFGIPELTTSVLTTTIVAIGFDSRLAGGTDSRAVLRYGVILTMCGGAVVGATMSLVTVAPVIALAAVSVAVSLLIFRSGPQRSSN